MQGRLRDMDEMVMTPIGTSPAWYNPGIAGSGYLLEVGGYRLLLDCGAGVAMSYLGAHAAGEAPPIDAIVISHVHLDHVADLVPLVFGMNFGPLVGWSPQLHLPPGARERLQRMVSMWDGADDFFEQAFDVCQYQPGQAFTCGPVRVTACRMPHFVDSYALRCEAGEATFGYTADLGPNEIVADFMHGVDLLLCEATLGAVHGEHARMRGHLTGREAGEVAQAARARQLMLTHVPSELDAAQVAADARDAFGGPVKLAVPGERVIIRQRLERAV